MLSGGEASQSVILGGGGAAARRQVRLGYDGWDESYDAEVDIDSGDFQPPGTCLRAGPTPRPAPAAPRGRRARARRRCRAGLGSEGPAPAAAEAGPPWDCAGRTVDRCPVARRGWLGVCDAEEEG